VFFYKYQCSVANLELSVGGSVSREFLGKMIIILDIIICIAFVIMTGLLDFYIAREGRRLDANHIQLPDFALTVKNLPEVDEY